MSIYLADSTIAHCKNSVLIHRLDQVGSYYFFKKIDTLNLSSPILILYW